eukprot:7819484-Pyramimonas_sp.AAC.1
MLLSPLARRRAGPRAASPFRGLAGTRALDARLWRGIVARVKHAGRRGLVAHPHVPKALRRVRSAVCRGPAKNALR